MCQSAGKTFDEGIKMGWLGCAIESEGSIQLSWAPRKNGYIQIVPRMNVVNKDDSYIEKVINLSKELGCDGHVFKHSKGVKTITWYGMKRVKKLLETIYAQLCDRKKQIADNVLEFINYRLSVNPHVPYGDKERNLFFEVRKLNGKGRLSDQVFKFKSKESSETIRQTAKAEDIVQSV